MTAQNHANDAMNKATQAGDVANKANELASKDSQEIASLRQVVTNLDDYKQVADVTIPFAFNKYTLTAKDKEELDNLVTGVSTVAELEASTTELMDELRAHSVAKAANVIDMRR